MLKTLGNDEEKRLRELGYNRIVGMDEAGVGPLAGPVVVGAVCLPDVLDLPGLNDSKQVSPKKRAELAKAIRACAQAFAIGVASTAEINTFGIRPAMFLAYERALLQISGADFLLVDAWTVPRVVIPQEGIIRGDQKIASIAAASILAKVHRDAMMEKLHEQYPAYGFHRHRGYGTLEHLSAIRCFGPCPEHRVSWGVFARL